MTVDVRSEGPVTVVTIDRPEVRNAVDRATAEALVDAFGAFDQDDAASVAVLTGAGGTFCAGADLKAIARGEANRVEEDGDGPMGPTRMRLSKPVLAAIEGYAVGGGLELALWCDLRVAADDAVIGLFNRRFGVPLIDLGSVRLPRLVGHGRALDMILTGRRVEPDEALRIGLVDRLAPAGGALAAAIALGHEIAAFPQTCVRSDRASVYEQWGMAEAEATRNEFRHGMNVLTSGETLEGASRFASGEGRHGASS